MVANMRYPASELSKAERLARALDQVQSGKRPFNMQLAAQIKHELRRLDMIEAKLADPVREAVQWNKTTDGLPKKPGKQGYEQIKCLIMLPNGKMEISMWNCEHEVWDDADGDDYRYDPCKPTHWIALESIRALAQKEGE